MGQFALDEAGQKRDQTIRLKEVWENTIACNQAKRQLHKKQELLVDHGALDSTTFDVNNKLSQLAW